MQIEMIVKHKDKKCSFRNLLFSDLVKDLKCGFRSTLV